MKVSELKILIQVAEDLGVERVLLNESRDGQTDYSEIRHGTIKEIGCQTQPEKAIILG